MKNIVIFGAPGSGKGTQSDKIIEEFGVEHISTGDVLRVEIKAGTELGKVAAEYINDGKLLPDALIIDILAATLDSKGKDIKGVIFDGFPRTVEQAQILAELLEEKGLTLDGVLNFEISTDVVVERMLARGREDDNEEVIRNRLKVYDEETKPLIDHYGVCRICFRELAYKGQIPGVRKASW